MAATAHPSSSPSPSPSPDLYALYQVDAPQQQAAAARRHEDIRARKAAARGPSDDRVSELRHSFEPFLSAEGVPLDAVHIDDGPWRLCVPPSAHARFCDLDDLTLPSQEGLYMFRTLAAHKLGRGGATLPQSTADVLYWGVLRLCAARVHTVPAPGPSAQGPRHMLLSRVMEKATDLLAAVEALDNFMVMEPHLPRK